MNARDAKGRLALCGALGLLVLLATGLPAWAQAGAPAEPTAAVPISVTKLVLLFVLFALIAMFGNWVAADVPHVKQEADMWYAVFLGGAAVALVLALAVPIFIIGWILALAATAAPVAVYVSWRNKQVPPRARVFTPEHIRQSILRILRHKKEGEIAADRAVHIGGASYLTEGARLIYMDPQDMPIRLSAATEEEVAAFGKGEQLLTEALFRQAGQIYLVPHGSQLYVRFRVSGAALRDGGKLDKDVGEGVLTFLKRLAGLDVAEHRKPQTGRFVVLLNDEPTNVTVTASGSVKGEHLSAKLHRQALLKLHLAASGMRAEQVARFHQALAAPGGGVVLMSAPKHHGRTVSMYAAVRELDVFARNVVAVEQEMTIEVPDINQVQVDRSSGQTLAQAVQNVLRSDPDVVMVETIADAETARIMLMGAAAGKTMIGGLVATDASGAVEQFVQLAGDRQNVAATLRAATGQRLMRVLCEACREAYRPNPEFLRKANLQASQVDVLYREPKQRPVSKKGEVMVCPICRNEGYTGRAALYEVVVLDDQARQELAAGRSVAEVRTMLRKQGQEFLQEEGLHKVVAGVTCVSELLRVLKPAS